ncbi:MAG: TonB-dependent receptor [bacterium]|nr:TonB-dependent receptor [bacterium]
MRMCHLLVAASLLAGGPAFPQGDEAAADDVAELAEVVVAEPRWYRDEVRKDGEHVSVIPGEVIEASSARGLYDIVSQVPGVYAIKHGARAYGGGTDATAGLFIRGIGGAPQTGIRVMLDGMPQQQGMFAHPLADSLMLNWADRVDIIKGASSVLHGNGAFGGVINIVPREPEDGIHGRGESSFGTFRTQEHTGHLTFKEGPFDLLGSGGFFKTEGHRRHTGNWVHNYFGRSRYRLNDEFRLTGGWMHYRSRWENPGPTHAPFRTKGSIWEHGFNTSIENSFDRVHGRANFYSDFGHIRMSGAPGSHTRYESYGLDVPQTFKLWEDGECTLGFTLERYGGHFVNPAKNFTDFITTTAPYVQVRHTFRDTVTPSAGIRMNYSPEFGWQWAPQFGMHYRVLDRTTLYGTVARGYNLPAIAQLVIFPGASRDLDPETVWHYETGISQGVGERVRLNLAAFIDRGSDLIRTTGVFPLQRVRNIGTFTHKGLELSGTWTPVDNLDLYVAATGLDPDNQTQGNPGARINSGILYRLWKLRLSLDGEYADHRFGQDDEQDRLSSYLLLNGKIACEVGKEGWPAGGEIYFAMENMLNQEYQYVSGYPMPGTAFTMGLAFDF